MKEAGRMSEGEGENGTGRDGSGEAHGGGGEGGVEGASGQVRCERMMQRLVERLLPYS